MEHDVIQITWLKLHAFAGDVITPVGQWFHSTNKLCRYLWCLGSNDFNRFNLRTTTFQWRFGNNNLQEHMASHMTTLLRHNNTQISLIINSYLLIEISP